MMVAGMQKWVLCGVIATTLMAGHVFAEDETTSAAPQPVKTEKMSPLSGTPVNSAISGGAIVPKGLLLSALNFSYRDKDDIVDDAGAGARTSEQELYLLKLRYGMADRFELAFVPGYVSTHRDAYGRARADHIEGPTDFALGGTYTPFSQRLGDPLSLGLTLGVNMPTGQEGPEHLPGGDVWSYNAKIGVTKVWHPNHRVDWDLGFVQPTETGNQGVRKDTVVAMTGSYHYVFTPNFDVGLEFTLENSKDWERNGVSMKNEYTELYVGPTMNFCMPQWNMWLGIGAFVPVVRDYDIPTASDDFRLEIKLGKIWSW